MIKKVLDQIAFILEFWDSGALTLEFLSMDAFTLAQFITSSQRERTCLKFALQINSKNLKDSKEVIIIMREGPSLMSWRHSDSRKNLLYHTL